MKVWVVMLNHWYQESLVDGVFGSLESAIEYVETRTDGRGFERHKLDWRCHRANQSLEIEEHEVTP